MPLPLSSYTSQERSIYTFAGYPLFSLSGCPPKIREGCHRESPGFPGRNHLQGDAGGFDGDHHDHATSERGRDKRRSILYNASPFQSFLYQSERGSGEVKNPILGLGCSLFQATKTRSRVFIPLLGIPMLPDDAVNIPPLSGNPQCFGGRRLDSSRRHRPLSISVRGLLCFRTTSHDFF